jgi:hypothetical protein
MGVLGSYGLQACSDPFYYHVYELVSLFHDEELTTVSLVELGRLAPSCSSLTSETAYQCHHRLSVPHPH